MGRPARLQHEIEHVREDILHAAGRALSNQGFDGVTIHDIAKEAGYTTPSLYAYFKGKREILDALVAAIKQEFKDAFAVELPRGFDFHARLALLFGRFADVCDRWPEFSSILIEYKLSSDVRLNRTKKREGWRGMDARLIEWLNANVTSAADLGGRKSEDVVYIIRSLILGAFLPGTCEPADCRTPRDRFNLALQVCLYGLRGMRPTDSMERVKAPSGRG